MKKTPMLHRSAVRVNTSERYNGLILIGVLKSKKGKMWNYLRNGSPSLRALGPILDKRDRMLAHGFLTLTCSATKTNILYQKMTDFAGLKKNKKIAGKYFK